MCLDLEIDVSSADAALRAGEVALLLDCREPWEAELARIEGAHLIPVAAMADSLLALESFRDKSVVVLCHHGIRSLMVVEWLRSQGFGRAVSMAGGIDAWSSEIDPEVPRY